MSLSARKLLLVLFFGFAFFFFQLDLLETNSFCGYLFYFTIILIRHHCWINCTFFIIYIHFWIFEDSVYWIPEQVYMLAFPLTTNERTNGILSRQYFPLVSTFRISSRCLLTSIFSVERHSLDYVKGTGFLVNVSLFSCCFYFSRLSLPALLFQCIRSRASLHI